MPLQTLDTFSFNHSDQVDKLYEGKTSAQVKTLLDSRGIDLQTKLNNAINVLKAITDADSGADNVGVTTIAGLSGNTVQAVLESLKAYITEQLQGITLGAIPNDSITETQMAADMKKQAGGVAKYDDVGNVANLTTIYKTIVGAINEIDSILDTHLSDVLYQTAGGTATAITLDGVVLESGHPKTFIASFNNGGSATTINGKPLYKPGTTTSPILIAGKAYTAWYNTTSTCFFIKASAEGNTIQSHVLAGETFSNDVETGLVGTAPLKSGIVYTPTTSDQTISTGWEDGTCKVKGDADLIANNIVSTANIFDVQGNATVESLGGRKYATGNISAGSIVSYQNGGATYYYFTVTGLSFKPSVVVTWEDTAHRLAYGQINVNTSDATFKALSAGYQSGTPVVSVPYVDNSLQNGYSSSLSNGFRIVVNVNLDAPTSSMTWAAYA